MTSSKDEVGPLQIHTPDNAVVEYVSHISTKVPQLTFANICFVHSLRGSRISTWTATNGVFWPVDLLPKDIPDARIITWGYDASIAYFWSSPSKSKLDDYAKTLLGDMSTLREKTKTTERPIILVAHSLGGIICAKIVEPSSWEFLLLTNVIRACCWSN